MNFSQFSPKNYVQKFARFPARFRQRLSEFRFRRLSRRFRSGIIAANAGNDASGIATYSTAGAAYGYTLLWAFLPMTVSLIVAQEMCVRMGVVTAKVSPI
jgi:Mn2+/Fe2+ NRAMP family transporter